MDFPYISLFPYNYSLILPYFAPFWAGPPCRPARFFFEGPRAPLGSGRGAPDGAPQNKNLAGRPGRHGGPAHHTILYTMGMSVSEHVEKPKKNCLEIGKSIGNSIK